MLDLQRLLIDGFMTELQQAYQRMYSDLDPENINIVSWAAQLALENIGNSDLLYHNVEHTMFVTLAGQSILEGRHLIEGGVTPNDWMHVMLALLCHDIGYVRGVCQKDAGLVCCTGVGDERVTLPPGCTDSALTPYHVDRSILFVLERFSTRRVMDSLVIDAQRIADMIEFTHFPVPADNERLKSTKNYGGLVRAADYIGQLGDPNYPRKVPALFYEFEETGINARLGYKTPGDLRDVYPKFYWEVISPYIQDALNYLAVTQNGKAWLANLYAHVFVAEHSS